MRSKIYTLFVVLMVVVLLVACGPTSEEAAVEDSAAEEVAEESAAEEAAAEEAAAEEAESEPVAEAEEAAGGEVAEIEFWIFSDYYTGTAREIIDAWVADFESQNPDIKITVVGKSGADIDAGIIAGSTSGDLPDVATTRYHTVGPMVGLDVLGDMSAYFAVESEEYQNQFFEFAIEDAIIDGKLLAVPFTGFATVVYRNLTVLEESGIDPADVATTWDEWLAQMEKVSEAGFYALPDTFYHHFLQLHAYSSMPGASNSVVDGKTTIDPEMYAQALEFMLSYQPYTSEVPGRDQAATDLFTSNQMAFYPNGQWTNPTLLEAQEASGLNYDYVIYPGPTSDSIGGLHGVEALSISSNCENPDAAWKWIRYMTDTERLCQFAAEMGRFVMSKDALACEGAQAHSLLTITENAYDQMMEYQPHFINLPANYWQPMIDYGVMVQMGMMEPEEAANAIVEEMNAMLAEND